MNDSRKTNRPNCAAPDADGPNMPKRAEPITIDATLAPIPAPASFIDQAAELGIEFDPGDLEQLGRYLAILLDANQRINLTAIKSPEEAWQRHIFDALTLLPIIAELGFPPDGTDDPEAPKRCAHPELLDVGCGGGLPGIPLAIAMPDLRVTLLDATAKKIEFLTLVIEALALTNAKAVQGRAEALGRDPAWRASFDFVSARAVGRLPVLAELTVPLTRTGGTILAIKGDRATEELEEAEHALRLLKADHVSTIDTPTGRVVVLQKTAGTPGKYPRADGEPKRRPLGVS